MNRVIARTTIVFTIFAFAAGARAQSPRPTESPGLELWAGVSATPTGPSGVLTSSYSPPLLFDGAFTSAAAQTMTFDTVAAFGVTGGANLWLGERAGLQILADRVSHALTGTSTPYVFSLHYSSRLPPNDELQSVDVHQTIPWPNVTGSFSDLNVSVNGVVRAGRVDRVSATASGGLTFHRLTGTLQPLAFTAFRLGGHSVLFEDDYRLAMALGPTITSGSMSAAT
jgi:hypothetical protein